MANFRDPQPMESDAPRRRTPTREESRSRPGDRKHLDFGSEAGSRHELFVPVAYPVAAPIAEAQHASEPSAPDLDDASYASSEREGEFSAYDESYLGTETSSPGGTYSLYSQGLSEGGAGRLVGTREWSRQQDSPGSRLTVSTTADEDGPWAGPGREQESGGAGRGGRGGAAAVAARRADGRLHDLPPLPGPKQASNRSVMSHDLSGFSDFDPKPQRSRRDHSGGSYDDGDSTGGGNIYGASITNPHLAASDPYNLEMMGVGGAAAAAADATNAAARSARLARQRREAEQAGRAGTAVSSSSSSKSGRPKVPPMPHGKSGGGEGGHGRSTVRDVGDTKEEMAGGSVGSTSGMSAFRISSLEAARQVGDPYDDRPLNENGTTGEYALPTYHSLIFTPLMFLICAILLFWEFSLNDWDAVSLEENPSYGPGVDTLIDAGAKRTDLIVDNGDWWRIWTPMFLHAGVVHFLFNMLGFLQVGAMVERVFGWWRVGSIYLVSGVFGTIVSAIFVPTQVMVGASGAIFGVFGALWADLWQNWSVNQDKCRMLTVLGILTVVNIVLGMMPYLDNFAHIGGMLMGFFMGLGLLVQKREDDLGDRLSKKCYQRGLQFVALVAVPTLLILGLSLLYGRSDPAEWCGWCENISCVEFPPGENAWWACDECSTVGFTANEYDNGTIAIDCPDTITRYSDTCSSASDDTLTECCIDICL